MSEVKYPGKRVTTNGNQLVAKTEARISDCGVFYPITPSTEQGENFETSVSTGVLNVFGEFGRAVETEGEHAAQGGAIAMSTTGKRVSNFTSGQGVVYGIEQYYHAPGKLSTMVLNVGARALTKHALNVHCAHDDVMAALDTGWTILMAKDAQQAVDQSVILRKVAEKSLTPGMNVQDGFLTTHLERTFLELESDLLREFLGHPADIVDTPNDHQYELFGPKRRRVPVMYDRAKPILLGPVQNQEHYMTGIIARRIAFNDYILEYLEEAYAEFAKLTGRSYGLISQYNCENADTVILSLGSSAENMEAGVDHIKEQYGDDIGIIHLNVIRPFPEKAIINALAGKKNVVVLERTDEPSSGAGPIARDIRTALSKARENSTGGSEVHPGVPALAVDRIPRVLEGVYGLGSRDFRPEGILGIYQFVRGKINRQDGKSVKESNFFYVGANHPYEVKAKETPSFLPDSAIAVRIHSIGGWGAITTGKNMAEIMGTLSHVSKYATDDNPQVIHISANPKYGSEKKGAPTNYFLVAARDRIRVNCDLKHVDAVLCCDPKIFTHTNPLVGLKDGGVFIWESNLKAEHVWQRIPKRFRQELIDKKIKFYTLAGFDIAKKHTPSPELQTRMQGNSFLGAFFKTSVFLDDHGINQATFLDAVLTQYKKKFGKLGQSVVDSNLEVMKSGFEDVINISHGNIDDVDLSMMTGDLLNPRPESCATCASDSAKVVDPIYRFDSYQDQYLGGKSDDQKSTAQTATGIIPMATGANISKFVARINVPVYNPYNCTQCMACIEVCPDTALPNTVQEIPSLIKTIFDGYIANNSDRSKLLDAVDGITSKVREQISSEIAAKKDPVAPFEQLLLSAVEGVGVSGETVEEIKKITSILPVGYGKTRPAFQMMEKANAGSGGLFSIFVSDLCKGCGECVDACGDHNALAMEVESDQIRGDHMSAEKFLDILPTTPTQFMGKYDENNLSEVRSAILHNHLMNQDHYGSFTSGDGSCAGCGEKSILRGVVSMTHALMGPIYAKRSDRLAKMAANIKQNGAAALAKLREEAPDAYQQLRLSVLHLIMGYGSDTPEDSKRRIEQEFKGSDSDIIDAIALVLNTDSANHRKLQVVEGKFEGMSVMAMTASTGCNTVYGSTHPANPHTYPWMNSLFQDGATIGWLVAESFILDHTRRSILPERLANHILSCDTNFSAEHYGNYTHFGEEMMTTQEVQELPKVWGVGGDGALGDIGFQNVSKTMLQGRPNMHILMLDTQVYSNTGGQNSDSSIMPGGFDMNQYGQYHRGKLTERKEVAQILAAGHGSPFVACVSIANSAKFYQAVLDGLLYRGSAFLQAYTPCQPEHGIGDDRSASQTKMARDCRAMPEFTFDPKMGEMESECFDLKGNPLTGRDWMTKKDENGEVYNYTPVQWAATEGRFRKHFLKIKDPATQERISLEEIILRIGQQDINDRNFLNLQHRSYIPEHGVYVDLVDKVGKKRRMAISRMMVLFVVERRRNWRRLQGRAGIANKDYQAQQKMLASVDNGETELSALLKDTKEVYQQFFA
ncbi:MAG: oxidoreductase [Bdellovibrionales bacterium]|nr:oxidoreductase [Bdellovibrionales bacterium]